MNKQQLLDALTAHFHFVGSPNLQITEGIMKVYSVPVYDVDGDTISWHNINYVVENDGLVGEVAYWRSSDPRVTPPFRADVEAYIAARIADDTFGAAFISSYHAGSETATAWAYIESGNAWNEEKIFLFRDGLGDIMHEPLSDVKRVGD